MSSNNTFVQTPEHMLAFLNVVTKNRDRIHPRQLRQKCMLAFLNVATRISNATKKYLNDSS